MKGVFNIATARPKGKGYEIRVSSGYDIHGKRIRVSRTWIPEPGMTPKQIQKELERQKVLFEEQIKYGICPDNRIRFVDFSKKWMEDYGKKNLSIKAYGRYSQYLTRINDGIGHLKLKDITPVQLNAFYKALEADGESKHKRYDADGNVLNNGRLAPKTILEHHRVISKILATAVKWDYLRFWLRLSNGTIWRRIRLNVLTLRRFLIRRGDIWTRKRLAKCCSSWNPSRFSIGR